MDGEDRIKHRKDDIAEVGVGQGELYSPDHAIKIRVNNNYNQQRGGGGGGEEEKGEKAEAKEKMVVVAAAENMRRNLGMIKEKVMDKLAAAAVPAEAMENARQYLEGVVREVSVAAQGLTKDALTRVKTRLVDLIPSLSPNITKKMVDDAEKETTEGDKETGNRKQDKEDEEEQEESSNQSRSSTGSAKAPFLLPTSSFFTSFVKRPISSRL